MTDDTDRSAPIEQPRLTNDETGVSHGVRVDSITLCGIDTTRADAGYETGWGDFGDMTCRRCRAVLDRATAALMASLLADPKEPS
jgi:hypothetical protein